MIKDLFQKYKDLEENFKKSFNSQNANYFLVSLQWLNLWKQKVGCEKAADTSINLNAINSDIAIKPKCVLKLDPIDSHPWNVQLKPNLVEGQDYTIVDQAMWKFLKEQNKGRVEYTLERESELNAEGQRIVHAYQQCIKFVPVFPMAIAKVTMSMIEGEQYVSPIAPLSEWVTILGRTLKTVTTFRFVQKDNVRIYKLPVDWTLERVKNLFSSVYKDRKTQFEFPEAEYLDPNDNKLMRDYNFQPGQIMIMDAKEQQSPFMIINSKFPFEEKCSNCLQYSVLTHICACKKVKYCSEGCLTQHSYQHNSVCEKQDDNDDILISLLPTPTSKMGLSGLRNLGNTCYMNSALQCLSNTLELSRYFVDNSFKFDINLQNTLGTKGQFANTLAYLFKRLWFDKLPQHSPFQFKRLVAKLSQTFAGNAQHDAQEFITFTLDLLNEDLNRIKIKPYVEIPDGNGRPDDVVSEEQWQCFKKRNDSLIVDHMYGQYRSQLQCPTCNKISITFDPYLMVNISIPQETKKQLEFHLIDPENYWLMKPVTHYYEPDLRLKEVLQFKSQEWLDCEWDQVILTLSSIYQIEEVFIDQRLELLKKQLKQDKKLLLRKLTITEQLITNDLQIHVLVHNQIQTMNNWKKDIMPQMYFIFSQLTSYKQIHLFLFDCFKNVMKHFADFNQEWLSEENIEEIYTTHILDKYWKLMFKSNQRYQVNCSYCYKNYCNDCPIDFIDKLFGDCLQQEDKLLQPELQIVWLKPSKYTLDDTFHDFQKIFDPNYKPPTVTVNWENTKNKYKQSYTLEHCIDYSTKPEQLASDNTWYCSGCQDHVQAFKTMQIYRTPQILIFHLKRFKDSYKLFKSKLQTNIIYPEKLDMTNFVLHKDENNLYELYAICNHIGESGGGHYTALCKNQNEWYKFDDAFVTKETGNIVTSNAYVLFYRKISQSQPYDLEKKLQENIAKLLNDESFKNILEQIQNDTTESEPQKQQNQLKVNSTQTKVVPKDQNSESESQQPAEELEVIKIDLVNHKSSSDTNEEFEDDIDDISNH